MINRRGFLFFLGAGATGLWLAGSGVVALPGTCSFCGKRRAEVRSILGVRAHPTRICDECIGLCMQIIAEEPRPHPPRPAPPPRMSTDEELARLLDHLRGSVDERELASVKRHLDGTEPVKQFACSFCDTPRREVWKLISGPGVFICDGCTVDASAVVSGVLRPV